LSLHPVSKTMQTIPEAARIQPYLNRRSTGHGHTVKNWSDSFGAGIGVIQLQPRLLILDLCRPDRNEFNEGQNGGTDHFVC
jgi:hypothetical protein